MNIKRFVYVLIETYHINKMSNTGYSYIDVIGKDGIVKTYFKKLGTESDVDIGNKKYIINEQKKMFKWGMPYFVFTDSTFGLDKARKHTITDMDAEEVQQLLKKARLVGQNTSNKGQMWLYLGLGGLIGILLGWVIKTAIGV